jgi:hypothetical protein
MVNKALNLDQAIKAIQDLEFSAKSDLNINELPVILVATSVGKHTMQYWHDNYVKWLVLLNNKSNSHTTGLQTTGLKTASYEDDLLAWNWRNLGLSDVVGAVAGAAGAAYVNLVPAWGQVAYGSAIVGGAVVNSVI